jgi:uncharacterized membrane protein
MSDLIAIGYPAEAAAAEAAADEAAADEARGMARDLKTSLSRECESELQDDLRGRAAA